jgi:hypothetical protein
MAAPRLSSLFHTVMTGDNTERKLAEAQISEMSQANSEGFVDSCLTIIASRSDFTSSIRHLASATLKQVTSQPCLKSGSYNARLFDLLTNEETEPIANMLAAVIAQCVTNLQEVSSILSSMLQSEDSKTCRTALKCLEELIELQPPSANLVFCPLISPILTLARAVTTSQLGFYIQIAQKLANNVIIEQPSLLIPALEQHSDWILSCSLSNARDEISLQTVLHFQRLVEPVLECLPRLLTQSYLMGLLAVLQSEAASFVSQNDEVDFTLRGKLASRRWEIVAKQYRRKKIAVCATAIAMELSTDLFNLMLTYSQATPDQVVEWTECPNKLLEQESDREDHVSWSTRDVVIDLAQTLAKRFPATFIPVVMCSTNAVFAAQEAAPWTLREAALCTIQHIIDKRARTLSENGVLDLRGLTQMILTQDLINSNPVIASRGILLVNSILVSSKYFEIDEENLSKQLMPACLSSMEIATNTNCPDVISACASKLLLTLTKCCDVEKILPYAEQGIDLLLRAFCRSSMVDDSLYLVCEALTYWISLGIRAAKQFNISPKCLIQTPETVVAAWKTHIQDPNIAGLMVGLFEKVVECEVCDSGVRNIFPWMMEVLCGQASAQELCIVPQVLSVVACIFERSSGALALDAANCFADPLCQVLLCSDDTSTISNACACFGGLVRRAGTINTSTVHVSPLLLQRDAIVDGSQMPKLDDEQETVPLTEALVCITAKLLGPERNEISLLNCGIFLEAVAKCSNQMSSSQAERFLSIVLQRALKVRTDTAFQQLLLPIATVACWNVDFFLKVCERSMLQLLQKWLPRQEQITEIPYAQVSVNALKTLLESLPASLSNQTIRWKTDDIKGRGLSVAVPAGIFAALCKSALSLSDEYHQETKELADFEEDGEEVEFDDLDVPSSDDGESDTDIEGSPDAALASVLLIQLKGLYSYVAAFGSEVQGLFSPCEIRKLTAFFGPR